MTYDAYALKARIVPTFFSVIIPIMVFNHFYVSEEFSNFVGNILGSKLLSNLTISGVCLYFLSEFSRVIGKNIFEKSYFKDERHMPTTNFMLFNDSTYSEHHKVKIREKMAVDFNVTLPTKEDEALDELNARVRIVEVMALVRKKLHGNKFLLQHNIEYGAMRNVIGGSVLGAILSIAGIVFFSCYLPVDLAANINIVTLIVYTLLILLSKIIIGFYGNNYAKILYREYLD